MSKWLENFEKSNKERLMARIEKLKAEIKDYDRTYRDCPWECYQRAKERREAELEELEALADPNRVKRELEDYKEDYERLQAQLGRIHILALNIDPSDQKSDANVRKLQAMTNIYSVYDPEFKEKAERGLW